MKDFDLKKECEKKEFDYNSMWKDEEDSDSNKKIDDFSKGLPRSGIKGHYIKKVGHVGRKQLKNSWNKYYEGKSD